MRKADLYLLLKNRRRNRRIPSRGLLPVLKPLAKALTAVISLVVVSLLFLAGLTYTRFAANLPSIEILPILLNGEDGELLLPTRLTDRSGSETLLTLANPGIIREYLVIDPAQPHHVSPQLVRAVVASLDPTFWENPGYSLKNWRDPQPATITERLVSDLLLWDEPPSSNRNLRMRLLAAQVVKEYGRTRVLEWYLNSAYFGHLAYGAESAAQLYLQKSARDLTLGDAALLTVLLDAPALNPIDAPGVALESQRLFLADLAEQGIITTEEFSAAVRQTMTLRISLADAQSSAPAFTRLVLQQLESQFGQRRLERGGLIVRTTLDSDLQHQFTCAATTQMLVFENPSASGVAYESEQCEAALLLPTRIFTGLEGQGLATAGLILDPKTGELLAYMGPTRHNGETRTDSRYQPGTLVSPFIALAGFTSGFSPASLRWDTPVSEDQGSVMVNPDGLYHGPVSLRSAIVGDYLTPLVQLANQVDVTRVSKVAEALGFSAITPASAPDLYSSKLQSSLIEVAAAYATLANSGLQAGVTGADGRIAPNLIKMVTSTNNRLILDRSLPSISTSLSEPLAYLVNNVLNDVTAWRDSYGYPNPLETGQNLAVKVGQVTDKSQVWTVGYTPDLVVVTWMGLPQPGSAEIGALVPAGLWNAMIKYATRGVADSGWGMPSGVTLMEVCVPSGMLPSLDCPATRQEVFLSGNEPVAPDTLYEKVQVNRETGQRATIFTDPELIEETVVMNVPSDLRQWAIDNGYTVAPAGYDSIPYLALDPDALLTAPEMFSVVGGKVKISGTAGGDDFSYYTIQVGKGINPESWQQLGDPIAAPVSEGQLLEWDTTTLDGLYAIRLLVVSASKEIHQAVLQVTVDNTPPSIVVSTPLTDQELQLVNGAVTLSANVQDASPLSKVEWWVDGKMAGTQTQTPYAWQLRTKTGKHTVQLKAWDSAGNSAQSPTIQFSITAAD